MPDKDESEGATELPRVNWKNIKWKNLLKQAIFSGRSVGITL